MTTSIPLHIRLPYQPKYHTTLFIAMQANSCPFGESLALFLLMRYNKSLQRKFD